MIVVSPVVCVPVAFYSGVVWVELLVAIACVVGIVGTVVPVLPGTLLCGAAILLWGFAEGGHAWWFTAAALAIIAIGAVLKYAIPGKRMKASGVPWWVMFAGAVAGIVGFFLIPVVGLFIGFILGVYVAEIARLQSIADAWPTTVEAMKAVGISTMIDLACAVFATAVWVSGVVTLALAT